MDPQSLMEQAIAEARKALAVDEIPIGCVIFHDPTNQIIARAHNRRHVDRDPTAHAELLALREASAHLKDWRLTDCTLVVTLEPCPMCAGAIVAARVPRLIFGCADPKAGAVRTLYRLCEDARLNHQVTVTDGIRAEECAALLQEFFRAQRALGKK